MWGLNKPWERSKVSSLYLMVDTTQPNKEEGGDGGKTTSSTPSKSSLLDM